MFLTTRTPKALVQSAYPKATCKKDYSGKVTIQLGAVAHDYWTHKDRDTFTFSYGTAAECWNEVAGAIGLEGPHKAKRDAALSA